MPKSDDVGRLPMVIVSDSPPSVPYFTLGETMQDTRHFISEFGLQIATDLKEPGFDDRFWTGVSHFGSGLQPGGLSYWERKGYDAAKEAFVVLQRRAAQSRAAYQQIEFKFD
jgi:hypothetical protein